jgi:hypothetical protein
LRRRGKWHLPAIENACQRLRLRAGDAVLDCPAKGARVMNDLSAFDGDGERDRQIVDLRVKGKSEAEVCQMLGVTVPDIHRALDRAAQASMTPQARVRDIYLDAARMERAQQIFLPLMESADDKAAMVVIRAQERKATLLGSNAPLRVDPIALATEVAQPLTSTQQLKKVWDDFMSLDKQALRNGGAGYGDWRDDRDREELARREREQADD